MWSSIIGHGRQIDEFKRALGSGRFPNAYLFCGPKGVGKRRSADAFAQALVCANPREGTDGCGECPACRKVLSGNHPDCFVVEPAAQKGDAPADDEKKSESVLIEQIRELQSKLIYHPLEARAKLAIIDDADRMTEAAANSLLKMLEEPPPATHFILITSRLHRILPTIRSRCRSIAFGPLSEDEVAGALEATGRMDAEEALEIARLSGGSLGMAASLDPDFVNDVMGKFETLTRRASTADILETAEAWAGFDPRRIRLVFDLVAVWYRDRLRLLAIGDRSASGPPDGFSETRIERCLSEIARARAAFDANANKQLMFENLLFSITG